MEIGSTHAVVVVVVVIVLVFVVMIVTMFVLAVFMVMVVSVIMVAVFVVLLDVLVRIHNYKNGTKLQTGQILRDLLTSLWNQSVAKTRQKLNSRKNS